MLFILKHIPGVAYIFFRAVLPVWNFVMGNLYALLYLPKYLKGKREWESIRDSIRKNPRELMLWYNLVGFKWKSDYWGGALDFSQKPWVSVIKRTGDCDDMMTLAHSLLQGGDYLLYKCYVYSKRGDGHAMLILVDRYEDEVYLMNNTNFVGMNFCTIEDAANSYFRADTYFWYAV